MFRTLLFAALTIAMSANAAVKIEKTPYGGWLNCYRITNGEVELIVTGDVGPRVIRYGFVGGQNLFKEFADQMGKTGEPAWQSRGGHRVWMAPEDRVLSYPADNFAVKIEIHGDTLTATAPVEKETGLEKQIVVKLAPTGSAVDVTHHVKNAGTHPRQMAVWALSVMAAGGVMITGFPPRGTHPEMLLPTNPLIMWAFTDFSDPRWQFTKKYLLLKQDANATSPQKTGHFNPETFGAYLLGSDLFLKRTKNETGKHYPDFGCSFETFTNAAMLEIETLGPLVNLAPGATTTHTEHWTLHKNVSIPSWTDAAIDAALLPLLK